MFKKLAIFPIDYCTVTFARYAHMGGYEPIALIAPELNVLEGNDISKLDGGSKENIVLYSDYMQGILEADIVYFVNSELISDDKIYRELVDYAKGLNKEVIVSCGVSKRLELDVEQRVNELTTTAKDYIDTNLLSIDVPIISIFTIGKNCGQPQTEFLMRKYFLDEDYKVMQIGSQEYSHILGCLNLPDFIFDSAIDVLNKIIMFNRFIHYHCMQENPDIILLGVPGSIMKYNDDILNGLGILPFIIQNAVKSDIGIVNMHYGDYTYEYLELISEFCKYRLEVKSRYFGISNASVSKNIDYPNLLEYLYLTTDFVKANHNPNIGKDEFTMFVVGDEDDTTNVCRKIERDLQSNPGQV